MNIVVYTKPSCGYCIKVKSLLQSKNLEYKEVKIGVDISRDEFISKFPPSVPQVVIDEVTIGGFEKTKEFLG